MSCCKADRDKHTVGRETLFFTQSPFKPSDQRLQDDCWASLSVCVFTVVGRQNAAPPQVPEDEDNNM